MTAVADSSPLVILTKLGCLDFLNRVFPRVYISNEVHYEVVVAGAGLPGASEVSKAEWIEVKSIQNPAGLLSAQRKYGLGPGEMSAIFLAKELGASPVLLDDYRARKLAKAEGLEILGSVGLLETFCLQLTLNCAGDVVAQKPRSGRILRLCPGIGMELRKIRRLPRAKAEPTLITRIVTRHEFHQLSLIFGGFPTGIGCRELRGRFNLSTF